MWVRQPGEADAAEWRATAAAGILDDEERPLKVVFTSPAAHWTDAAPLGNGRLGAMVWGGVASETIQLNGNLPLSSLYLFLFPQVNEAN